LDELMSPHSALQGITGAISHCAISHDLRLDQLGDPNFQHACSRVSRLLTT
jgi:hypothetical protein